MYPKCSGTKKMSEVRKTQKNADLIDLRTKHRMACGMSPATLYILRLKANVAVRHSKAPRNAACWKTPEQSGQMGEQAFEKRKMERRKVIFFHGG